MLIPSDACSLLHAVLQKLAVLGGPEAELLKASKPKKAGLI
jgi:hypothetical protein